VLVEAAWHARRRPNLGPSLAVRLAGQPAGVLAVTARAQERLHTRYWRLVNHGKRPTVAATAVARGLAGFCWSLLVEPAA
jgi:hypothetical protein